MCWISMFLGTWQWLESRHLGVCCTDSDCYWPLPVAAGIQESNDCEDRLLGIERSAPESSWTKLWELAFLSWNLKYPGSLSTNSQTLFLMRCPLATEGLQRNGVWLVLSSNPTIWEFLTCSLQAILRTVWGRNSESCILCMPSKQECRCSGRCSASPSPPTHLPTSKERGNANGDGEWFLRLLWKTKYTWKFLRCSSSACQCSVAKLKNNWAMPADNIGIFKYSCSFVFQSIDKQYKKNN